MDFDRLFYAESIAVVGASPRFGEGKIPFYQILQAAGYQGKLVPVNPAHTDINGVKVYPSLADVPDRVDLAIASVPHRLALATLEQAVAKRIPFVHFFTSGFSEIGRREAEDELVAAARKGGTRIVGPNCLGVHCAASKVTFDNSVIQPGPGCVAFLGQSGGVTNNFMRRAYSRQIALNKVVSYGNQIDLRVEDFLEYFAADDQITVVAAYVEDIKNPRAFFDALRRLTPHKPVIILKGGSTAAGARAAMSHTGALAGDQKLWSAIMRQRGVIEVDDQEELIEAVMMACAERRPTGPRAGFFGAGGGTSVLFTDLAEKAGLTLPLLDAATRDLIASKIPAVNTSTANPVDLGAFGFVPAIMTHTMRAMDNDPNLDLMVPYLALDFLSLFPDDQIKDGVTEIARAARELGKPVVPVVFKSFENQARLEQIRLVCLEVFREAGLPVFFTPQDAVLAAARLIAWEKRRAI